MTARCRACKGPVFLHECPVHCMVVRWECQRCGDSLVLQVNGCPLPKPDGTTCGWDWNLTKPTAGAA